MQGGLQQLSNAQFGGCAKNVSARVGWVFSKR
jgi:hypothetical protein